MDLLEGITSRQSCARLCAPAPSASQLETLFQAASRAPDHGRLRPWRFMCVQGEGLTDLGQLFIDAQYEEVTEAKRAKLACMPLRAPMVLIAYAHIQQHPKVPALEQIMASAAAIQNVLLAAFGLGIGAMWRSGDLTTDKQLSVNIKQRLGLAPTDELMGFIYLGQPAGEIKATPLVNPQDNVSNWPNR